MHLYTWQKEYDLHVEVIDLQHKNLLALINKLLMFQNEPKGIVRRFLEEVIAYAEFHFLSEDNLMMITHYGGFEQHQNVHRMLLKQLKNQYTRYESNQCELKEIIVFLAQWLIEHITADEHDRAFAKHLKSSKNSHYLLNVKCS